jgi:sulfite reductase alpha subunit-like flavoprotein
MRALLQEREYQSATGAKRHFNTLYLYIAYLYFAILLALSSSLFPPSYHPHPPSPLFIPGANILYFGCKNKAIDYIYRDELEQFYTSGVLTEFHTAFSRDGKAKEYVQHLMVKDANAKELYDAVEAGAYVYVCGATAMGHDVMAAFLKVMQEKKGVSSDEALKFVKRMQDDGKYVQELWTA